MTFKEKLRSIKRYRTKEEKEALFLDAEEVDNIRDYLKILEPHIEIMNETEGMALLFKAIELSVDEKFEFIYRCEKCDGMNIIVFDITKVFDNNIEKFEIDEGVFVPAGIYETLDEIMDTSNIPLKYVNAYEKKLLENVNEYFKPYIDIECKNCGEKQRIYINPKKYISKYPLAEIYKQYSQISFFTHNSYTDIEKMYPFEREIILQISSELVEKNSINFGDIGEGKPKI